MAAAGDRIDKFTLVRQLGAGGMGQTWEAVRQNGSDFEQRVAIKLADRDLLESTDGLESFRREASLAASLRHPNIAAVLDLDDQHGYIVCELVDGADLRAVMRAAPGCKMDWPVLVHIVGQIARGLAHAHKRILRGKLSPVIHRDMSPGNVVIDYDGNVKIVDFGIARALSVHGEVSEAIKGKLSYMAPEQAMGSRMDARVDQYALGVIAYEALTSVRPNDGAHEGETLASILGGKHVPLKKRAPDLPAGLAAVFERMLALRPEQRWASMDAVLDALAPFAPPFTVHRDLIPLVIAARKPHTIVRENGQFISRPVEIEAVLNAASAAQSDAPAPSPSNAGARDMCSTVAEEHARPQLRLVQPTAAGLSVSSTESKQATARSKKDKRHASGETRVVARGNWFGRLMASRMLWQGLTVLGAVLLALVGVVAFTPGLLDAVIARAASTEPGAGALQASRHVRESSRGTSEAAPAAVEPSVEPPSAMPAATVLAATGARDGSADLGTPSSAAVPEARRAPIAPHARARHAARPHPVGATQALDGLVPTDAPRPQPSSETSTPPKVASDAGSREHAESPARGVVAETPPPSAAPLPSGSQGSQASVRIKVFPWGRVWVDQKPRGSAPPIMQLTLPPGKHVVAVGADRPLETRTVELAPGADLLVAFDIEGRL